MRRNPLKGFLHVLVVAMILLTAYQLYGFFGKSGSHRDAGKLLYQVSLIQIELLNGYLQESAQSGRIDDSDALKQLLYLAQFTHERLVLIYGEGQLTPLESLDGIMRYIMRMQISGRSQFQEQETVLFRNIAEVFLPLYEAYRNLLDADGKIVSSQNDLLRQRDEELLQLLRQHEWGT